MESKQLRFQLENPDIRQICSFVRHGVSNWAVGSKKRASVIEEHQDIVFLRNTEIVAEMGRFAEFEGLKEVLDVFCDDGGVCKYFSALYDEKEQIYQLMIPGLEFVNLKHSESLVVEQPAQTNNRSQKKFKRAKISRFKNLNSHQFSVDEDRYVLRKSITKSEVYDIFSIDFDHLSGLLCAPDSIKSDVLDQLQFFGLSKTLLARSTNLVLEYPRLACNFRMIKDEIVSVNVSVRFSIAFTDAFDANIRMDPKVVEMVRNLLINNTFFSPFKVSPTYYELGYEFLNQWNGVGASNLSIEEFNQLYGTFTIDKHLSEDIKNAVFQQIKTPNTKVFYNMLTEYASKLLIPQKAFHKDNAGNKESFAVPGLDTNLFGFQAKTLLWCLDKENVKYDFDSKTVKNRPYYDSKLFYDESLRTYNYNYLSKILDKIVFGWAKLVKGDDRVFENYNITNSNDFFEALDPSKVFWFNKYTGYIVSTKSILVYLESKYCDVLPVGPGKSDISSKPAYFAQNMISEEMGLGKTIELTALVLSNPRRDFLPLKLAHGVASSVSEVNYIRDKILNRKVLKSKTTLLVCPDTILSQWVNEMATFAPSLNVLVYKGFKHFYKSYAARSEVKQKRRFLIKLKYDPEKLYERSTGHAGSLKFSSFKEDSGLKLLQSSEKNANDISIAPFVGLENTSLGQMTINGVFYLTPIIWGQDVDLRATRTDFDDFNLGNFDLESGAEDVDPIHRKIAFELSQYDVILTSYRVVTQEMHYAQYNAQRRPARTVSRERVASGEVKAGVRSDGAVLSSSKADYSSPLVLLQFWRVILDEVQMVSSSMSNAAKTCKIFARCHSWGISGTPIKKNLGDLMSYISFLRIQPFTEWSKLEGGGILTLRGAPLPLDNETHGILGASGVDFMKLVVNLAIRHDKTIVKNDIKLPKQKRLLLTSTFTPVEQDNYSVIFKRFLKSAGLNANGEPVVQDWTPDTRLMRDYLTVLRKVCCFIDLPGSFGQNRALQDLKQKESFSMADILARFLDEVSGQINDIERSDVVCRFEIAETYELEKKPEEFQQHLNQILRMIKQRIAKSKSHFKISDLYKEDGDKEEASKEELAKKGESEMKKEGRDKMRLRGWIELLHKVYFFLGNSQYQIGELIRMKMGVKEEDLLEEVKEILKDEKLIEETVVWESLEPQSNHTVQAEVKRDIPVLKKEYFASKQIENKFYKIAEYIRDQILQGHILDVAMKNEKFKTSKLSEIRFDKIQDTVVAPVNIKAVKLRDLKFWYFKLFKVVEELNIQCTVFTKFTGELTTILFSSLLVEKDADSEGAEYEDTIVDQEKAFYLMVALEYWAKLRDILLTGNNSEFGRVKHLKEIELLLEQSFITEEEIEKLKNAQSENGSDSQSVIEEAQIEIASFKANLKKDLEQCIPSICDGDRELSVKTMRDSFESLQNDGRMLFAETEAVEQSAKALKSLYLREIRLLNSFKTKGMASLNVVYNARVAYYKQLQAISDTVQSTDFTKFGDKSAAEIASSIRAVTQPKIDSLKKSLLQLQSRNLYLRSLETQGQEEAEKTCIICQSSIIKGIMLECGHHFCTECIKLWRKKSNTCPLCKAHISNSSTYEFTYTKQKLELGEIHDSRRVASSSQFYEPVDAKQNEQINSVTFNGHTFGAKTDAIVKLILWLKETHLKSGSQVQIVVFSQWEAYLKIVAAALKANEVGYVGLDNKTAKSKIGVAASKFKSDGSTTCFLLNAHQQAAGLTLVNATQVILCEPLVNTALELQAINRIHRIGQRHETTVWMVGISGSVEESIIDFSTKKRLAQLSKLESSLSNHYAQFMARSKANSEDTQLTVDSLDMAGETDKMTDYSGDELVPVHELWECFFSGVTEH